MINSIKDPGVKLYVIWRGFDSTPEFSGMHRLYFQQNVDACSVSEGRNILLRKLLSEKNTSDLDVVCFADDDGLWPDNLPKAIRSVFEETIPWALGTYGPCNKIDTRRFPVKSSDFLSLKELITRGSSLGIYSTLGLIKTVGFFDESIGLGTQISIGEDTDFIIRLASASSTSPYRPKLCQIHQYGTENSNIRSIDSLELYLHLKRKGILLISIYLHRIIGLYTRGSISFIDIAKYLLRWFFW